MPFPIAEDAKVAVGVPVNETLPKSAATIPDNAAVPLNVAEVLPSNILLLTVIPVIVKFNAVILALNPDGCVNE